MSRTYRHTKYKFLPKVEEVWIDWNGEQRIAQEPADGWMEAGKHYRQPNARATTLRETNRRVRRDKAFRNDWDNYTLAPDKPPWWD